MEYTDVFVISETMNGPMIAVDGNGDLIGAYIEMKCILTKPLRPSERFGRFMYVCHCL